MPEPVRGFSRVLHSSVAKYGFASMFARSFAILGTLLITPLAIDRIGLEGFGIWVLATQIPSVIVSPDLGLTQGLINQLSSTQVRESNLSGERARMVQLSRLLRLVAFSWFILGLAGAALFVCLGAPSSNPGLLFGVLVAALAIFTAGIPPTVWAKAQLAQGRGHETVTWEALGKLVSLLGSIGILLIAPDPLLLAVAFMLPQTVASWLNAAAYERKEFCGGAAVPRQKLGRIKQENAGLFNSGKYFVLMQVAFLFSTSIDPYIVGFVVGQEGVSYINVVRRPFDALPMVVGLFSVSLWPVFARMAATGQTTRLSRVYGRVLLSGVALVAVGAAIVLTFQEPLFAFLSHGQVEPDAGDLTWAALQTTGTVAILISSTLLNALGDIRWQGMMLLLGGVVAAIAKVCVVSERGMSGYFVTACLAFLILTVAPICIRAWRLIYLSISLTRASQAAL